jgi:hypothetical protein
MESISKKVCPVCKKEMNSTDNPPFVLTCDHLICKSCKTNLQVKSEGDDGFFVIKCPVQDCNKSSEINVK